MKMVLRAWPHPGKIVSFYKSVREFLTVFILVYLFTRLPHDLIHLQHRSHNMSIFLTKVEELLTSQAPDHYLRSFPLPAIQHAIISGIGLCIFERSIQHRPRVNPSKCTRYPHTISHTCNRSRPHQRRH